MARFDRYEPGQFSWVDLMTHDVRAAESFYAALFQWTAQGSQDDAGGAYTMFSAESTLISAVPHAHDTARRVISIEYTTAPFGTYKTITDQTVAAMKETTLASGQSKTFWLGDHLRPGSRQQSGQTAAACMAADYSIRLKSLVK